MFEINLKDFALLVVNFLFSFLPYEKLISTQNKKGLSIQKPTISRVSDWLTIFDKIACLRLLLKVSISKHND